jgi:hypothetical protein
MALAKLDLRDIDWDLDGFLNAGGKLHTYAAGTTTDQATYADADGTANANPIMFDSSGQAHVWLTKGLAYKFVWTDAVGVELYSEDNVVIADETATGAGQYLIQLEFASSGPPTASQLLGSHTLTKAVTWPVNFAASLGHVMTAGKPTADADIDVRRNATSVDTGESVGTITYLTTGVVTFATALGAEVQGEISDNISFWAPTDADDTFNYFDATLIGDLA